MVCDVLSEYYECNRNVSYCYGTDVCTVQLRETTECLNEGELRKCYEGTELDAVTEECGNRSEVAD